MFWNKNQPKYELGLCRRHINDFRCNSAAFHIVCKVILADAGNEQVVILVGKRNHQRQQILTGIAVQSVEVTVEDVRESISDVIDGLNDLEADKTAFDELISADVSEPEDVEKDEEDWME